ncbi:hypothetical protein L6452_18493 [Arctium lappa]|uniref:Uncharacterized protein n=1 Tax=Arctium lappa TaxID=4217 RepID=A0ACB9C6G7_ARCLA|nr:hypothetical protein L6452_18493 [Arctium lappa]
MSFIVGRLVAGKEGAYFLQESKHVVSRLVERTNKPTVAATNRPPIHQTLDNEADILPEILKHSLPSRIFQPPSDSTLTTGRKEGRLVEIKNLTGNGCDTFSTSVTR